MADRIDLRLGPATETLARLLATEGPGSQDLAFIDADKTGYDAYYEACLQLVRPGGIIAIDNVLWSGRVADPAVTDADTAALRALNVKIRNDRAGGRGGAHRGGRADPRPPEGLTPVMGSVERPLSGRVAVVTGASRGAGKGIAVELGAAGATVYVTGRSTRAQPATSYARMLELSKLSRMPGTIEDTAEEVTREGGRGVAVRCDHTDAADVERLFARVEKEEGRLDLLVNNAWGGHEAFTGVFDAPFWEQPLDQWEAMLDRGVRNHLLASRAAVPSMLRRRAGLVVTTTFWDRGRYVRGNLLYDLAKSAMNRLAFGMAEELRPHGIASVAVSPGWMRTELILAGHRTDEAHWRERPALARTESPRYLGRAVVALAADPRVLERTGQVLRVADLAREYGFTDVDGRQVEAFEI